MPKGTLIAAPAAALLPGQVRPRPQKGHSQLHGGVHPLSPFSYGSQKFQPLPNPLTQPPYHYDLESSIPGIGQQAQNWGRLVFPTAGDTGGIKNPDNQTHLSPPPNPPLPNKPRHPPHLFL